MGALPSSMSAADAAAARGRPLPGARGSWGLKVLVTEPYLPRQGRAASLGEERGARFPARPSYSSPVRDAPAEARPPVTVDGRIVPPPSCPPTAVVT